MVLCLHLIVDRMASAGAMVWTGLNHIRDGHGWQWSDGAPLSLVNFTTGTDSWFASGPSERENYSVYTVIISVMRQNAVFLIS